MKRRIVLSPSILGINDGDEIRREYNKKYSLLKSLELKLFETERESSEKFKNISFSKETKLLERIEKLKNRLNQIDVERGIL